MLPNGWSEQKLGGLFDFKNGANTEAVNYGSGVKFVNVMDVFKNNILTCKKIKERVNLSDKKVDLYKLKMGDILFNRTSETFDEIALTSVYLDSKLAIFGGFVIRGRPTSNQLDFQYCIYCFSSAKVRKELIRRGQGAIRANIGQSDIRQVFLLVPPLPEQQKIAKVLSTWDKAIEKLEALISAKQQRKKALMQHLLTGKKRFNEFNEEWEAVKIKDIAVKKSSNIAANKIEENEGDYKIYGASGVLKTVDFFTENDCYISIVKDGAGVGRTFLCEKETSVLGTMDIIKAKENVDLFYLYAILKQIYFACYVTGSTIPHIYFKDYSKERIKLPSLVEQQKIASVLSAADNEIENNKQQLATLKQQKKGLMQQLLTGKKRVKLKE